MEPKCEKKEVEYVIRNFTTEFAGSVMMDCFFGNETEDEKIQGVDIPSYISKLIMDL